MSKAPWGQVASEPTGPLTHVRRLGFALHQPMRVDEADFNSMVLGEPVPPEVAQIRALAAELRVDPATLARAAERGTLMQSIARALREQLAARAHDEIIRGIIGNSGPPEWQSWWQRRPAPLSCGHCGHPSAPKIEEAEAGAAIGVSRCPSCSTRMSPAPERQTPSSPWDEPGEEPTQERLQQITTSWPWVALRTPEALRLDTLDL